VFLNVRIESICIWRITGLPVNKITIVANIAYPMASNKGHNVRSKLNFVRSVIAFAALSAAVGLAGAKDLVVAQVAPFGGNLAVAGRDFNLGAMIAFDEVNSVGGIEGQQLRLVSRDDGNRPADTVRHVTSLLKTEAPVVLIGLWGAESAQALLRYKILEKTGVAVVGVRSGDASLRTEKSLFHVRASYRDEVLRMLEQVRTMGVSRIAIAHEDDAFGREALVVAREAVKGRPIKIETVVELKNVNQDATTAVKALATTPPQAVLLFANTNAAAAFIKPLRQSGSTSFILATSTVEIDNLVGQIGADLARGVSVAQSVPNPYKPTTSVARSMLSYMKLLGIAPERANFASLEGYISAQLVIEALKRAGSNPTPAKVSSALESIQKFNLGGFTVDFGPEQRSGSSFVELSVISTSGKARQ
jgi:branched-chain amino acid transport system substrate-binding protein